MYVLINWFYKKEGPILKGLMGNNETKRKKIANVLKGAVMSFPTYGVIADIFGISVSENPLSSFGQSPL